MTGQGPLLINKLALWSGLPQWHVVGLLAIALLIGTWIMARAQR
jgi:hypothetical protein